MSARLVARIGAVALAPVALVALGGPASAAAERMHLDCGGFVVERTNGSSWWDVNTGEVYVARYLLVTSGDETVYEKSYGVKNPHASVVVCDAEHAVEWGTTTWHVELVPTH